MWVISGPVRPLPARVQRRVEIVRLLVRYGPLSGPSERGGLSISCGESEHKGGGVGIDCIIIAYYPKLATRKRSGRYIPLSHLDRLCPQRRRPPFQ